MHAIVARSAFLSQNGVRTTFGSSDVEKVHAVVARNTCRNQNIQNTPWSDHFWKLRCRKSARRCGAKHMSKSKYTKHTMVGPLLEVEMSKKCTALWREEYLLIKIHKARNCRTTFGSCDVEKVQAVVARTTFVNEKFKKPPHVRTIFGSWDVEKVHGVVARSTCRFQNLIITMGSDHFWKFRYRFAWQVQGIVHLVKSEQKTWGFCSISKMMYFLWQVQYKRYVHQSYWRSGRW